MNAYLDFRFDKPNLLKYFSCKTSSTLFFITISFLTFLKRETNWLKWARLQVKTVSYWVQKQFM
jgi:hypothetical protein